MTQSRENVLAEREGRVLRLTLNRPDKGNAISVPLARDLMHAVIEASEDSGVRCVLLTGAGRLFCAGGDIAEFSGAGDGISRYLKELTSYMHSAITHMLRMPKPLVTAINGPTAGAGVSLAILGDIALASDAAHFTMGYGAIGLSPDCGSTWYLPRVVGLRRAQEMTLLNERVSAERAAEMGLVTRSVKQDELADEAMLIAQKLATGPVRALGRTRALLQTAYGSTIETHMEEEAAAIAASGGDPEGREGVASFLERRKPDFLNKAP